MTKDEIINFIQHELGAVLNLSAKDIDPDMNFLKIGITSLQTLKIVNKLRKILQVDINPIAMFEYKTIAEFSGYLSELPKEEEF